MSDPARRPLRFALERDAGSDAGEMIAVGAYLPAPCCSVVVGWLTGAASVELFDSLSDLRAAGEAPTRVRWFDDPMLRGVTSERPTFDDPADPTLDDRHQEAPR